MSASNQHSSVVIYAALDELREFVRYKRYIGADARATAADKAIQEIVDEVSNLFEQLNAARAEAARSEAHAEERDLVAQEYEEQLEVALAAAEGGRIGIETIARQRDEAREQLEAAQKAQHVQNLEWAISLAESDPLYAEVFRPYFQKIMDALASNPAKESHA